MTLYIYRADPLAARSKMY